MFLIFPLQLISILLFAGAALGAPIDIVVSIAPQKWLVSQVGGTMISVNTLIGKGQDPHSFQPTPRQIAHLSKARFYFTIDMAFEKTISNRIKHLKTGPQVVDISQNIHKIQMDRHTHLEEDHHHADHKALQPLDPHIWLSPVILKQIATTISDVLIEEDPDNREQYKNNLKKLSNKLENIHAAIKKKLAPFTGSSFYVFHPSFGYFAQTYHLHQEAIEVEGKSPPPRQLQRLIKKAKDQGAKIIFIQPQFDPKSATAIASAIDGHVIPLDPLAEDIENNLLLMADKIAGALSK